jgi:hypothetical protein
VIVSRDRDLWQLVGQGILIMSGQHSDPKVVDRHCCQRVMGVAPDAVALYKAMQGDKSDNIPRAVPRKKRAQLCDLANEAKTIAGFDLLVQQDPTLQPFRDLVALHYRVTLLQDQLPLRETKGKSSPRELYELVKHTATKAECTQAAKGPP